MENKIIYWHTTSHVLAQAVKRLYPDCLLVTGPATKNGFFYDFDVKKPFDKKDLELIEKEMKKIIKKDFPIERLVLTREDAAQLMKNEPYKVDIINILPVDAVISFYKQGEFTDLCRGPHLESTGQIKAFKILSATGAYFKGDKKNKMLCRVSGVSFPSKELLEKHLTELENAKQHSHIKLGRELEIFTTAECIGKGLPILLPNGSKIIQILKRFVEDEEEKRGYLITNTPLMAKSNLYKISGHWDHYKENMFIIKNEDDGEVLALRPMTCPFQFQVFLNKVRSYKDLPMRLSETSTLFRNEASGEMHGLIRIRQFTLSDGHVICTEDQLSNEFKDCLELSIFCLKKIGLYSDVSYRFSKCDFLNNKEKYMGTIEEWANVQEKMKSILDGLGLKYENAEGEAAFYGPKLDIQIKNTVGKEDTLITIQIDFQLAKRFHMEYTDKGDIKKFPYVVHRSSIGCYERTLALMIEKFAGAFPVWIAPIQILIIPIDVNKNLDYAKFVENFFKKNSINRIQIDISNEKFGLKIRRSQIKKIPYTIIIGDNEQENESVSVRTQGKGNVGSMKLQEFLQEIKSEIEGLPEHDS